MQIDPSQREAFRRFADAVHAFAREPDQMNFMRYLAASRALEESRRRSVAERAFSSRASQ